MNREDTALLFGRYVIVRQNGGNSVYYRGTDKLVSFHPDYQTAVTAVVGYYEQDTLNRAYGRPLTDLCHD